MKRGGFLSVYTIVMCLAVLGGLGNMLFFEVQENFYGEQNLWLPLYQALGMFQLSMTSFSAVIFNSGGFMMGLLLMLDLINWLNQRVLWVILYAIPVGLAVLNTVREIRQAANPAYPDNFVMDILVAWVACAIMLACLKRASKYPLY